MTMLDMRLTETGREIGLVDDERQLVSRLKRINLMQRDEALESIKLKPVKETNAKIEALGFKKL